MEELLKQFGLNTKERKVFLELLLLGAQPVSILAKHVKIARTSLYSTLESLNKKDLVEHFERFGIKYVRCIPVNELHFVLERKEQQLKRTSLLLHDSMKELETIENSKSLTPQIKVHDGKDAVMRMYSKILNEKSFCAYFHPKMVEKYMPEFADLIPQTIKKKNIDAKEVLVDSKEAYEYKKQYESKNHQIKILPKNYFFASDTIICKDRVCVILYDDNKHISAVEIFNWSLRQTQKMTFEMLWSTA